MELLFQAGLPVNVKEHLKMHFKHRNERLCSGSLSPAMCHLLNSPNLPDTSRKLSLRMQLLQLHMPVTHTMANSTALNTWGYNSNPDTNHKNCPGSHLTVHRILSLFILSRFITAIEILRKAANCFHPSYIKEINLHQDPSALSRVPLLISLLYNT